MLVRQQAPAGVSVEGLKLLANAEASQLETHDGIMWVIFHVKADVVLEILKLWRFYIIIMLAVSKTSTIIHRYKFLTMRIITIYRSELRSATYNWFEDVSVETKRTPFPLLSLSQAQN